MSRRGLTLFEVMIVLAILTLVGCIAFWAVGRADGQASNAREQALQYAKDLGLADHVQGASCADKDTDGDGYVSCSISLKEGDRTRIQAIECATKWSRNEGCRVPKALVRTN